MAGFVGRDQEQEGSRDGDHADDQAHGFRLPDLLFTKALAQRSASRMSSRRSPPPRNASKARSTVWMMRVNGISRARNALTASSLAAFSTAGRPPPAWAAALASRTAGNRASSSG